MASKSLISVLITMMLVTGVANTLLTKYQDNQCVRNCDAPNKQRRHYFEQPVLQTAQMFVGEMGCWLVVAILKLVSSWQERRTRSREAKLLVADDDDRDSLDEEDFEDEGTQHAHLNHPFTSAQDTATPGIRSRDNVHSQKEMKGFAVLLLALPSTCDICGTTLMNVGLLFVAASIYQMTRGALVLFVGLFSVLFLRRRLYPYQWFALFTTVAGVGIVGLAGAIYKDDKATPKSLDADSSMAKQALASAGQSVQLVRALVVEQAKTHGPNATRTIIGILLIAAAQIFTATQFVLEEHLLERYSLPPLEVVGWEGTFGLLFTVIGMIILHFLIGRTPEGQYGYFDMVEGWREMTTIRSIGLTSLAIMISIGGFNFFGLSVTRSVSATSRSLVDTCRTLFIWIVSLALGWETFKWLQIVGFGLLVYGTFLFNDLVRPPLKSLLGKKKTSEAHQGLLSPDR